MSDTLKLSSFHMAGIVPVAGQPLDFNMPWHDCMMPIAPNFLAVERAISECAAVGCKTIWLVLHKEMQPLLRHKVGEWTLDPYSLDKHRFAKFPSQHYRQVPIYYVPIHPKDRDKRDCLSHSVIYGARRAFHVTSTISKWATPDKYYVAFPYGVYNALNLKNHRTKFCTAKDHFLSFNGKTVKDGEYLGFSFGKEGYMRYRDVIKTGKGRWQGQSLDTLTAVPVSERWDAKHFSLDKVFGTAIIDEEAKIEIPRYRNIGSWKGYTEYLGSVEDTKHIKFYESVNGYHEFSNIARNDDEQEDDSEERVDDGEVG